MKLGLIRANDRARAGRPDPEDVTPAAELPGQRALGAMAVAARRARETGATP
ncbi:MAG: hypothetical protein ACLPVF_16910 [Acidimicrobiales bacterium]